MNGVSIIETAAIDRLINQVAFLEEKFVEVANELKDAKKPWMTVEETCEYMRMGSTWLYANKSKIGFSKPGGVIVFSRKKVDAYLESNGFQSSPK